MPGTTWPRPLDHSQEAMGNFWQDPATAHEGNLNRSFAYEGRELEVMRGRFQKPCHVWKSLVPPPTCGKGAPTGRALTAAVVAAALTDIVHLIKLLQDEIA